MATGREIKEVFDMMKKIYQETSKLMIVINDMMENEGFEAVGDGSVMWGKSSHYRSPEYWLPYFMQRVYVKEKGAKKGIGINIMFDGSVDGLENSIPFITCGLLESTDGKVMKCNELYLAVWTDSDVEKQYDGHLSTTTFDSDVSCTTYFLPLELLTNQDKVNNYIIQPLIHLFKNERSQVNTLIDEVAIGIEEIIG